MTKILYIPVTTILLFTGCKKDYQCDCKTSSPHYKDPVNPATYYFHERAGKKIIEECEYDYIVRDKLAIDGYTCYVN